MRRGDNDMPASRTIGGQAPEPLILRPLSRTWERGNCRKDKATQVQNRPYLRGAASLRLGNGKGVANVHRGPQHRPDRTVVVTGQFNGALASGRINAGAGEAVFEAN